MPLISAIELSVRFSSIVSNSKGGSVLIFFFLFIKRKKKNTSRRWPIDSLKKSKSKPLNPAVDLGQFHDPPMTDHK